MPRTPSLMDLVELVLNSGDSPPNNHVYHRDGYYVSYLPYAADTQSDETAIVYEDNTKIFGECMLILYGNHVDALKDKTLEQAKEYWVGNADQHGATTDTLTD